MFPPASKHLDSKDKKNNLSRPKKEKMCENRRVLAGCITNLLFCNFLEQTSPKCYIYAFRKINLPNFTYTVTLKKEMICGTNKKEFVFNATCRSDAEK